MSACRLVATMVSSERGLEHHARGHRVDQHAVGLHVGIVLRHFVEDLVPQHHAVALRVRLGDQRQVLARALARQLEREAVDALDAGAREHGSLGGDLLRQAPVHAAAGAGVLALGVLADDDPVDVLARSSSGLVHARAARATGARWRTGRSPGRSAGAGPTARCGRARRARRPRRRRWRRRSSASRGRRRECKRRSSCISRSSSRSARTSMWKSSFAARAWRTSMPAGMTSLPMPSPGMDAIR